MVPAGRNRDWRTAAACRDTPDPELFFPTAEAGPVYEAQVAAAKAVCAGCLVRAECLAEALARIPYGIAGGLTPEERRTGTRATAEAQLLARGLRRGARRREVSAAGLVLLAAGRSPAEVADRCGVHLETVRRWRLRQAADSAEGSAGGNRAPLLISHTSDPLAGTPTQEGGRV